MAFTRIVCLCFALLAASGASAQSLTIYCEDDKPLQYFDSNGKLTGMVVEIVQEIQRRVGNRDPIIMVPWARGLKEINTLPNVVLFSMSRNADRNDLYHWIGPTIEAVYGFYVRADSPVTINSLEDAKKLDGIGVYRDDFRDQFLTKAGFKNLERWETSLQVFKMLMNRRFEAVASSSIAVKDEAERSGYKVSDVRLAYAFVRSQLYIAVSKNTDPGVVAKWNLALDAMKKDGTFAAIFKKYYPHLDLPGPAITKF